MLIKKKGRGAKSPPSFFFFSSAGASLSLSTSHFHTSFVEVVR